VGLATQPTRTDSEFAENNEEYHKMSINDKPLIWLSGEIKTPPFSQNARLEAGFLLRKRQKGKMLVISPTISPNALHWNSMP